MAYVYFEETVERRRLMKRLTPEEAVEVAQEIARALTAAAEGGHKKARRGAGL